MKVESLNLLKNCKKNTWKIGKNLQIDSIDKRTTPAGQKVGVSESTLKRALQIISLKG
jgi:hypothetical protein